MKKHIYLPVAALMALAACSDDDYSTTPQLQDVVLEPVANTQAESFVGSVILSWDLPDTDQYYYSLVEYTDSEGNPASVKISRYSLDPANPARVRALVSGFTDTDPHQFTITHYSYAGNASAPFTIEGLPLDRSAAKDFLVKDVVFTPLVEAVNISWANELNAPVDLKLIHLDYFNTSGNVGELVDSVDALNLRATSIDNLPIETDIAIRYCMIDRETGVSSDTLTATFQVLPTEYDVYSDATMYIPQSYYGINMMSIEWNDKGNEFCVVTSGTDPYIYTQLPGQVAGTTLVFRYHSVQNIKNFELFLNGRAPGGDNEVVYVAPDGYQGLRLTNGYWKTVKWDLSEAQKTKFDFVNNIHDTDSPTNKNKIRIDFGAQNKRTLYFRNMHFE